MPPFKRTGKPLGKPPGTTDIIPRHPAWLQTQENHQLLIYWMALGHPRRLILEYCKDQGITVSSGTLGQKLQTLATYSQTYREQIVLAHEAICAMAADDAYEKRGAFLAQQYIVRDILFERMFTERDTADRTHMVRDFIHIGKDIAEVEGFKKGTFDPRQEKAVKALTDYMFPEGEKDAAPPSNVEVRVLESRDLNGGSDAGEHSGRE